MPTLPPGWFRSSTTCGQPLSHPVHEQPALGEVVGEQVADVIAAQLVKRGGLD